MTLVIDLVQSFITALKKWALGFPGGAVVGSLPASAGDAGSSPGLGGSHVPRSGWAREPRLLGLRVWSLCSATREARASRWGVAPACRGWRKPSHRKSEDPTQPKSINQSINQTYASDSRSSLKKKKNEHYVLEKRFWNHLVSTIILRHLNNTIIRVLFLVVCTWWDIFLLFCMLFNNAYTLPL